MESCWGPSTLPLFPPTFLPFSPSSPSPSPSHCSVDPPGPPRCLPPSPPLLFSLRDRWGRLPSRCPGSTHQETQCLDMPWPAVLPARSQASCCPYTGMDPCRGPLRVGTKLELPLARRWLRLSGKAAGCAFSRMLTSFAFSGITGIPDGAAIPRALFLLPWADGWRDVSPGGTCPPGWGARTVMPAGSPSFPTAGCLPPACHSPTQADSE